MALHLNLYHEIEKEKQAKRRDPLKLSLIGLGVIAAFFAGYYFLQYGSVSTIHQELLRKESEFAALLPKSKLAEKRTAELAVHIKTSELFVKRIEGRFYWAPLLELITRMAPDNVQITRLTGELQGENSKRCTLSLDGISAGPNPREPAESFRMALEAELARKYHGATASFRSLEEGAESVKLAGKPSGTANFQISIQLVLGEEAPATAPVRRKSK